MDKMTTLPHGTTIEILGGEGLYQHRVCCPGGGICRIARDSYEADDFAKIYEDFFNYL